MSVVCCHTLARLPGSRAFIRRPRDHPLAAGCRSCPWSEPGLCCCCRLRSCLQTAATGSTRGAGCFPSKHGPRTRRGTNASSSRNRRELKRQRHSPSKGHPSRSKRRATLREVVEPKTFPSSIASNSFVPHNEIIYRVKVPRHAPVI